MHLPHSLLWSEWNSTCETFAHAIITCTHQHNNSAETPTITSMKYWPVPLAYDNSNQTDTIQYKSAFSDFHSKFQVKHFSLESTERNIDTFIHCLGLHVHRLFPRDTRLFCTNEKCHVGSDETILINQINGHSQTFFILLQYDHEFSISLDLCLGYVCQHTTLSFRNVREPQALWPAGDSLLW